MRLFELQREERAWRKAAFEVSVMLRPGDGVDPQSVFELVQQSAKEFGWQLARWQIGEELGEEQVWVIFYLPPSMRYGAIDFQRTRIEQDVRKKFRRLSRGKHRFKVAALEVRPPGQPAFRKGSVSPTGWHHVE